jgi:thymidine phosphorylase
VCTVATDGSQPVGVGIGPALQAHDVLAILRGEAHAPMELRRRACALAARILELSSAVPQGEGERRAARSLDDGSAWKKFQAICDAQGGMREPTRAAHTHAVTAKHDGRVVCVDNRRLARAAKLAGAPKARAAGLEFHTPIGSSVERGQPLFTLHAEAPGELRYALAYVADQPPIVELSPE